MFHDAGPIVHLLLLTLGMLNSACSTEGDPWNWKPKYYSKAPKNVYIALLMEELDQRGSAYEPRWDIEDLIPFFIRELRDG